MKQNFLVFSKIKQEVKYRLHKWVLFKLVNGIVKEGFTYYMSQVPLWTSPTVLRYPPTKKKRYSGVPCACMCPCFTETITPVFL